MARLAAPALALALGLALPLGGCATLWLPPHGTAARAERLLEQGRAAEALAAAREVPRRSPDYAQAQAVAARASALQARAPREALARGETLEASGKLFEAIRVYEEAALADPRHAGLLARLAAARDSFARERERRRFAAERAESQGRLEAERAWSALSELDPSDRDARRRLAELAAARPALATVHLERAKSLREEGRLREGLEEAALAARLDPTRADARALALRLRQDTSSAAALPAAPAARLRADAPALPAPGTGSGQSGEVARPPGEAASPPEDAAKVEAKGKPQEPGRPDAKAEPRADARAEKRPASKAQGSGEPAADQRPREGAPPASGTARASDEAIVREAVTVAQLAARRGDYPRALRVLARAEERVPRATELVVERTAVQRLLEAEVAERIKAGIAKFQREDLEGATEEWGRALELDPENAVALDYRKKAQGMLKRIEEIREEVRQRGDKPAGGP